MSLWIQKTSFFPSSVIVRYFSTVRALRVRRSHLQLSDWKTLGSGSNPWTQRENRQADRFFSRSIATSAHDRRAQRGTAGPGIPSTSAVITQSVSPGTGNLFEFSSPCSRALSSSCSHILVLFSIPPSSHLCCHRCCVLLLDRCLT